MTKSAPRPLLAQCRLDSPLGPMTAATTAQGLAGLWFDGQTHHPGPLAAPVQPQHPLLQAAARALALYWAGRGAEVRLQPVAGPDRPVGQTPTAHGVGAISHPDTAHSAGPLCLPLDLPGTEFQRAVWQALLAIPMGQTSSYRAIAQAVGRPAAVRAAGAAIGRNPVSVLVPCHRVLGAQGALTGYAGGLPRKKALLAHEAAAGTAWATVGTGVPMPALPTLCSAPPPSPMAPAPQPCPHETT